MVHVTMCRSKSVNTFETLIFAPFYADDACTHRLKCVHTILQEQKNWKTKLWLWSIKVSSLYLTVNLVKFCTDFKDLCAVLTVHE